MKLNFAQNEAFLPVADGSFQEYLRITLIPHYLLQCDLDNPSSGDRVHFSIFLKLDKAHDCFD